MKLEWENIDEHHTRAKVYGGWLVKAYHDVSGEWDWQIAITFVPDPNYEWTID